MLLTFTDKQGNKLSDFEIFFRFDDNTLIINTDSEGQIELTDGDENTEITCYISENQQESFSYENKGKKIIAFDLPKEDMLFVVADKNGNAVTDLEIVFEYNETQIKEKTDSTGQLILKNIPIKTKVRAFQQFKNKEVNEEFFVCKRNKAQYFYVAEHLYEKADMQFILVDEEGKTLRNADIRFRYEGEEFEKVTDNSGKIVLKDIKIGSTVECKQMVFGKSLPIHTFKFEKGIDEYIIHGEKLMNNSENNKNHKTQIRTRIQLVNSKDEPIPNAIIRVEYNEKTRNKYSNQKGEIQIDDILTGTKVHAKVDLRGNKAEREFVCEKDNEVHKLILKTDSSKALLWIIPVLLVALLAYGLSKINFKSLNKNNTEQIKTHQKKDTLIIKNYHFTVKDKKSKKLLESAKVSLYYDDTTYSKKTNNKGITDFKSIHNKLPEKVEAFLPGYKKLQKTFKPDSMFTLLLTPEDSTDIILQAFPCGELTQSEGAKITVRTFNMKMPEGRFKLFYNMFDIPDKIEVYNGSAFDIAEKNLIFSSNEAIKGMKTFYFNFSNSDSLITVKITGSTANTQWLYKIFCAKLPKK